MSSAVYGLAAELWREFKDEFSAELQANYDAAREATGDVLVSDRGMKREIDPWRLFASDRAFALAYASQQLLTFWEESPRPVSAAREKEWLSSKLLIEAPSLSGNSSSAIYSWAGRVWRECRADYQLELEHTYAEAEAATNTAMLNKRGLASGVSTWSLLTHDMGYVKAYASREMIDFLYEHGRMTFGRFEAQWLASRWPDGRKSVVSQETLFSSDDDFDLALTGF